MAIDFLIFTVLLISFIINFLALAAFWVTPGLRTIANRFTINLLIINLVGCLILAPTLFLSGSTSYSSSSSAFAQLKTHSSSKFEDINITTGSKESAEALTDLHINDDTIEFYSKPGNHQMTIRHNGKLIEKEGVIVRRNISENEVISSGENEAYAISSPHTIETIFRCNSTYCKELTIDENSNTLVITEIEESSQNAELPHHKSSKRQHHSHHAAERERERELELEQMVAADNSITIRSWSIDMAAALGAMAVLLVVGDTWCAVTDPLRYHTRISGLKSWLFIAFTWCMGLLFGALSAFREIDFESDTVISKQKRYIEESQQTFFSWSSTNNIFSMIFACLYFLLIILLPFGFVCGMYWRIISEARENGLRMRQNGSSPLLQSALNLTHGGQQQSAASATAQQYSNSLCVHRSSVSSASSQCGGLQMQIDQPQQQLVHNGAQSTSRRGSPACLRRDSAAKVLLPPISDDGMSDVDESPTDQLMIMPKPTQNIILTLQSASGEIKRNYSTRQLELLATSSQDICDPARLQGIRQVHSSPNLQRCATLPATLQPVDACSPHLLGGHLPQNLPSVHLSARHHAFQQSSHSTRIAHPNYQPQHLMHHPHNHHQLHHLQQPAHHQSLQIPSIQASPKAISYMSSLRHRLSNASSLFKYREESRAARISILVVIMFLVSYLPYGFLVLLQCRMPSANFKQSTQLAIFMILLANMSSPFIFAYRNKRVRRGVKRLVGLDALCREQQLQRQNSSSCRIGNGNAGSGSRTNLKRNSSRLSTYSTNSGKYLTPQSSVVSNGPYNNYGYNNNNHTSSNNNNNNVSAVGLPLRPNSSCSTIINFSLNRNSSLSQDNEDASSSADLQQQATPIAAKKTRPLLQRGITIIEQVPIDTSITLMGNNNNSTVLNNSSATALHTHNHSSNSNNNNSKMPVKHKLYKLFFKSSNKLNCAAQACAQGTLDVEPAEV